MYFLAFDAVGTLILTGTNIFTSFMWLNLIITTKRRYFLRQIKTSKLQPRGDFFSDKLKLQENLIYFFFVYKNTLMRTSHGLIVSTPAALVAYWQNHRGKRVYKPPHKNVNLRTVTRESCSYRGSCWIVFIIQISRTLITTIATHILCTRPQGPFECGQQAKNDLESMLSQARSHQCIGSWGCWLAALHTCTHVPLIVPSSAF